MARKISKKGLKKKACAEFSRYIRLKYADNNGNNHCVTCGVVKHYKEMQAGHFVDGRNSTVLFDEMLVHPQCFHCNSKHMGCLSGNKLKYTAFMMDKYKLTIEQVVELDNLKFKVKKMTDADYEEVYQKYKSLAKGLEDVKGT